MAVWTAPAASKELATMGASFHPLAAVGVLGCQCGPSTIICGFRRVLVFPRGSPDIGAAVGALDALGVGDVVGQHVAGQSTGENFRRVGAGLPAAIRVPAAGAPH